MYRNKITGLLIKAAQESLNNAHPKHSKFKVGAALLTGNGKIYRGVNIEFDAFSLTVCAERTALFNAVSDGETKLIKIAIATNSDCFKYPCGLCRQALAEFNPKLEIILINKSKKTKKLLLKNLIPKHFKL